MSMTKEELLKFIDDAIDLEDRSIQIYRKHLDTALFWSGLADWEREQLKVSLDMLAKGSGKHAARLNSLKDTIVKGGKDVY